MIESELGKGVNVLAGLSGMEFHSCFWACGVAATTPTRPGQPNDNDPAARCYQYNMSPVETNERKVMMDMIAQQRAVTVKPKAKMIRFVRAEKGPIERSRKVFGFT